MGDESRKPPPLTRRVPGATRAAPADPERLDRPELTEEVRQRIQAVVSAARAQGDESREPPPLTRRVPGATRAAPADPERLERLELTEEVQQRIQAVVSAAHAQAARELEAQHELEEARRGQLQPDRRVRRKRSGKAPSRVPPDAINGPNSPEEMLRPERPSPQPRREHWSDVDAEFDTAPLPRLTPSGAIASPDVVVSPQPTRTPAPNGAVKPDLASKQRRSARQARIAQRELAAQQRAARQEQERARQEQKRAAEERARQEQERAAQERTRQEQERAAQERTRQEQERAAQERTRLEQQRAAEQRARQEQERAAEQRARQEQERAAQERARQEEERARQEQERAAEQRARLEQERVRLEQERAAEERARQEEERAAQERARQEEERAAQELAAQERAKQERARQLQESLARQERKRAAKQERAARRERAAQQRRAAKQERERAAQELVEQKRAAQERARQEQEHAAEELARQLEELAAQERIRQEQEREDREWAAQRRARLEREREEAEELASRELRTAEHNGAVPPAPRQFTAAAVPARVGSPEQPQSRGQEAPGSRRYRTPALVAAVVLLAAGAVVVARFLHTSGPNAADIGTPTQNQAAAWVAQQVSPSAIVSCEPAMCLVLKAHGVPTQDLFALTPKTLNPLRSSIVVATAAIRDQFGSRLTSVYAPAVQASFGSGKARIDIRIIAPHGAHAYLSELRKDKQDRTVAGTDLLTGIATSGEARAQLAAGQVDVRLIAAISSLTTVVNHIDVIGFGDAGPGASPGIPLRSATLTGSMASLRSIVASLRAQKPPYRPSHVTMRQRGGKPTLVIEFAAPIPLELLEGSGVQ
jgi:hypothetical protein